MTEKILKFFGIKSKRSDDVDPESIEKSEETQVIVEKYGSLGNLKMKSKEKQSMMVSLLKNKHEQLVRKKSASENNLNGCELPCETRDTTRDLIRDMTRDQPRAPLCGAESGLTMVSDASVSVSSLGHRHGANIMSDSTQSVEITKG